MKINDLINEGYGDNMSTSNASGQKYFIDSFTKQLNAFIDSSRKAGQPIKIWDFVYSYLTKYGWTANPEQTTMLKSLSSDIEAEYNVLQKKEKSTTAAPDSGSKAFGQMANQLSTSAADQQSSNVFGQMSKQLTPQQNWKPSADSAPFFKSGRTGQPMKEGIGDYMIHKAGNLMTKMGMGSVVKLANAVYTVGMTQHRDPRTGMVLNKSQNKLDDTTVDAQGQQIMKSLKSLKGPKYEKDLEEIIKLAMWNLYGTDKQDYSALVNSLVNKKNTAHNPNQNQQQNP